MNMEKDMQNSKENRKKSMDTDTEKKTISNNSQSTDVREAYSLSITNSPGEWTLQEVVKFVKNDCGIEIAYITDSMDEEFKVYLSLDPKNDSHQKALAMLNAKNVEGKLSIHLKDNLKEGSEIDSESGNNENVEETKVKQDKDFAGPSKASQDVSPESNSYYIRESYLESLGIKPPISNWVIVTNFRCDKSELKEVLELAGRVSVCSLCSNTKLAKVRYSHALEAVQAVSMLNGQQYYGNKLQVTMCDLNEPKGLLPKGLVDVGPGLGKYGKSLPDVGEQYKLILKGKPSELDSCIFKMDLLEKTGRPIQTVQSICAKNIESKSNQNETDDVNNESPIEKANQKFEGRNFGPVGQKPASVSVSRPPVCQSINNVTHRSMAPFPNKMQPMTGPLRGPIQTPRGPVLRTMGGQITFPMVNPRMMATGLNSGNDPNVSGMMHPPRLRGMIPGPMAGSSPRGPMVGRNRFPAPRAIMGPRPGPGVAPRGPLTPNEPGRPIFQLGPNVGIFAGPDPTILQITNLPPSTTLVSLGKILGEFGIVVFLELTTPGCANVRFSSTVDVERCLLAYRQANG
ncbi:uncharacterized protein LOC120632825 isoform X1 [Pararge aegeria]|uniref:uncharacterized protein LOC120632825 isoform X1 n=2 Tax=Pararge aegeria TaxID=116150 RepID=UPI0019D04D8F|nr:uncharacterized protein LOC120632825 isoform X1 [Pararge aegeria]XP_039758783.1 uncharacterized protein LOC120632825 isoform X1 [Pararge aegeria]XP_039758784.1 uncharacterized protein LOC120632825 isoform X1 [Pararge aegeria]